MRDHEVVPHGIAANEKSPAICLGKTIAEFVDCGIEIRLRVVHAVAGFIKSHFFHGGLRWEGVSGIRILPAARRHVEVKAAA